MASTDAIEFFGSLQSPYCYFALDRIEGLARARGVSVVMRPALPAVLRIAESYAGRSEMEMAYFDRDVERTAAFLGLPFRDADPSPVDWAQEAGWVAAPKQRRIYRLYNMLFEAQREDRVYPLYASLMRLIWSGETRDWDRAEHLKNCLTACGLSENLLGQGIDLTAEAARYFAENQQAMYDSGHWGVPMFSWRGEPFYGQDRIDQLHWRIETSQGGLES